MNFRKTPIVFCLFFIFAVFFSCKKEEGPWWDADFSGPVAKTTISIKDLFPDSINSISQDSSLILKFKETVFDLKIDSLFSIPDTTLDTAYVSPLGGYSFQPGDQIFITPANESYLNISGVNLKQLILKSGKIKLELISSVVEPLIFKYDILNSDLYGIPFSITEEVPGSGSITKIYDIGGLNLNLSGIQGNLFNTIITQNTMTISNNANAGVINFGEGLIIKITFMDIIPFYAKGYLGTQQYSIGPETINSSFLKGIQADYFSLEDASVNLSITNNLGADIQANNVLLTSKNSNNNNQVTLSGTGVYSSYNINRATFQGLSPQPIVPSIKNYTINSTNSNIKSFIENLPDQLMYSTDILVNPLGNVSGNNDFVLYGYGLKTDLDIEIPFSFAANNLRFRDTAEIDFTGQELNNINRADLYLRVNNGYPFSALVQGYLCDDNFNVVDSLFSAPGYISPATINTSNVVSNEILTVLPANFNSDKLEKLKSSKKIIFSVRISTVAPPQTIKIYDFYKMDLILTADVNYSVNKK